MHKNFIKALTWNSSTTFLYKIILLSHQILLYSVISKNTYGLQNSLFALIYTLIAISNFGFDETLLPFFATFSQSKESFLSMLKKLYCHIFMLFLTAFILYAIIQSGSGEFLHNITIHCNKNFIFLICSIFLIESCKKTAIAIMQLAFLNQQIAYGQITSLISYILTIWIFYHIYQNITILMIFFPFLVTTTLELAYYTHIINKFRKRLPQEKITTTIPFQILLKQQLFNYFNQINKAIYSPNSITLFFAYALGFQQAATIKFYTNLITLCYTCLAKVVGVTTGATLAAMNKTPLNQLHRFFTQITYRYFQFLYLLTTILTCIVGYAWYINSITSLMALQIILFFTISFLEQLSITYEQLLLSQNKSWYIAIINCMSLLILIPCMYSFMHSSINQSTFLSIFICIKFISLCMINRLCKKHWKIN